MRRKLAYALFVIVWLALALALERLTYEAAPWFIANIPERWSERYIEWYGATSAESVRDAEFLAMFTLCLLITGVVMVVPWWLARLAARTRDSVPRA